MFTGIIVGTGKVTKIDQQTKNRSAIQMTVNLRKICKRFEGLVKVLQSMVYVLALQKFQKIIVSLK